ncbi:MAG: NUDIX domain-containing protein [Lentisphaerae bacterium]|jgi:ADP-ribose pyrophosphatase YjhB (NUDIX family)|nr:NUDIX domain-containing protein [Lentisphaerota bacterium]MBT4822264.1 NUDIX domain-containing protein [Lentisphaerota bacterium]MBT5604840.1 NUDIX domain-containing protein [Lentisphaerota bacterium]MBT7056103.1 NUDIX domain-containing protein [Lentisphaerota bacterium]MBT7847364.1 NUDIX domain-containing protein [Lentisphaerota bacterium]
MNTTDGLQSVRGAYRHCPACGAADLTVGSIGQLLCRTCSFELFLNPAVAVGALILDEEDQLLLVRRDRDPRKGKLGVPGGFADPGENAEEALAREVMEEIGLQVTYLEYLCSFPNRYDYRDICYPVMDLFFTARVNSPRSAQALDEVEDVLFLPPDQIQDDEIAFATLVNALRCFRQTQGAERRDR